MADQKPNMYPFMRFADAEAALQWLSEAFGFQEHVVYRGDDATLHHAEIALGPGIVMLGQGDPSSQGVYVAVEDADAHYERAKAAGAEITREVENTDYGSREYSPRSRRPRVELRDVPARRGRLTVVSSDEARQLALALPEAVEQDHHGRPSFRVAGKIFATLWDDQHMNVMLDEGGILTAVEARPKTCEQVWWGKRLAAVRVDLRRVETESLADLLRDAWERRARLSASERVREMEPTGLEPVAFWLPARRSPN